MDNGCEGCKRPYKVDEVDDKGFPLHVRYCNECVKQCSKCGNWKTVKRFYPKTDTPAYEDWIKSRDGSDGPLGLLLGRENYLDECAQCRPFRQEPPTPLPIAVEPIVLMPPKIAPPNVEEIPTEDVLARIEALLGK